jgi:hypothetical protein
MPFYKAGDGLQDMVPHIVPERIIHALEVIEIAHDER